MILSYVSVLILIMSPVLRAALVAPNSLSIQEILDYCVNYILINAFIWNSSQAFLKFFFNHSLYLYYLQVKSFFSSTLLYQISKGER